MAMFGQWACQKVAVSCPVPVPSVSSQLSSRAPVRLVCPQYYKDTHIMHVEPFWSIISFNQPQTPRPKVPAFTGGNPSGIVTLCFWFYCSSKSGVDPIGLLPKHQPFQNLLLDTAFFYSWPRGALWLPAIPNARGISNARWWKGLLTGFCCNSSSFVSADSYLWDSPFLKRYRILHAVYKRRYCLRLCPYLHFLVPNAEIVGMNFWSIMNICFNSSLSSVMGLSIHNLQHMMPLLRDSHTPAR